MKAYDHDDDENVPYERESFVFSHEKRENNVIEDYATG